jgi:hypothetical protein
MPIERRASLLMNYVWFLETSEGEATTYPYDFRGVVMTRQQWLEAKRQIDAFYADTSDNEIEIYNHERLTRKPAARTSTMQRPSSQSRMARPGYIYLLHGEDTPWYKIGISGDPKQRVVSLGTRSPFPINVVAYYDVENMEQEEAWWHDTLAHKRKHGEWFELDEPDIDLFIAQEGRAIR